VYYDVMLLAASDVVVGTFSSQVSRLAYEVAQANSSVNVDASLAYRSIDSMWCVAWHCWMCVHARAQPRA
jgi:hypothetical protein